jgi:hypothetical protein
MPGIETLTDHSPTTGLPTAAHRAGQSKGLHCHFSPNWACGVFERGAGYGAVSFSTPPYLLSTSFILEQCLLHLNQPHPYLGYPQ